MITDAKWIACAKDCETPMVVKTFDLKVPVKGSIDITGLGYFELYLNGNRVSDDRFVPVLSDYQPRTFARLTYPLHDTFSHRIYYLRYNITPWLHNGENKLEILLGNGWYRQVERTAEGTVSFGDKLKTLFSVTVLNRDGTVESVQSDGSEVFYPSCISYSNLFIGEIRDSRMTEEKADSQKVEVMPPPDARLVLQKCPADRVIREIRPALINMDGNRNIYDVGETISGWVKVCARQKSGARITLRFSEALDERGRLDFMSTGSEYICSSGKKQIQTDTFICNGTEQVFEPRFVFHAFRYFDVEGAPKDLTAVVVHSDVPVTSSFHSGNETLNWLYSAFIRTQLANMHGGVPSDCPHRERLGYTGDGQVVANSGMLLLGSRDFYKKWIFDIMDSQDTAGGHVPHTAPFMGGGGGPCGWGCAVVVVPYRYYRHFGDKKLLKECYPHMRRWIDYIKARSEKYLVIAEEEGGWCLGDWAAPEQMRIPEPFVNTCYFVKALGMLRETALLLDRREDAESYAEYAGLAKSAIAERYFSRETGSFCGGVQGADAFALDIGLSGDPRTLENLRRKYRELGRFDTGFLGTDILIDVLFRYGCHDIAYDLLTNDQMGGYRWMKEHGATTIWETFDGNASLCHPMFGAPVQYLFQYLLGIRQKKGYAGFSSVEIAPVLPENLNYAYGEITTVHGDIAVSWNKKGRQVNLSVEIPETTRAEFLFEGREQALRSGRNKISFTI